MNKIKLLIIALLTISISCNDEENSGPEKLIIETLSGFVQKGPFINGTSITVSELDASLGQTGNTFNTQIVDNSGNFELKDLELSSPFVQLQADGFYFNEVIGEKSNAQLTLFALSDISSKDQINVNVLTHLEKGRVEFLINQEIEFSKAKDSAQHELLSAFGVDNQNIENSEELNISINNSGNATLIALSIILQANNSVADLTELLANINTDFRQDGIFNSESIRSQVYNEVQGLNLEEIRTNLEKRYSDLGLNADIPDFESVVDLYLISQKPYNIDAEITNVSCNGMNNGAIDITINEGSEPFVFEWSNGATTEDIDGLSPGSYSVYIVDGNGYEMKKENIEITEPLELTGNLTFENITQLGASNGNIEVNVIGGTPPYSYLWSNDSTSSQIDNLDKGVYSVTITDSLSCEINLQSIIQEPIEIASIVTDITCNGKLNGSISLEIMGGLEPYNISWSSGSGDTVLTELASGTYTVSVTDSLGYSITEEYNINEPDPLIISSQVNNTSAIGSNDGNISLEVSGGTQPYTYLWSNGATTASQTNLTKGFYSVIVTDANECSSEMEIAVQEPIEITLEKNDLTCYDGNDGNISLSILGGIEPYSVRWSNGSQSTELTNLSANTYSVTVSDELGYLAEESIEVTQPDQISLDYDLTRPSAGSEDGEISLIVSGGTSPYQFSWSNGATSESSGYIGSGELSVTVTDANLCTAELDLTVYGTFVDTRDDRGYSTIKIGNQIWMAENLNTTLYNDQTSIQYVGNTSSWENLTTGAYTWPGTNGSDESFRDAYGILYNWYAVNTGKLCPQGWHVPSDSEWTVLSDYLGGESVAGGKLKEEGTSKWNSPNSGASNESKFSGVPTGYRFRYGISEKIGDGAFFWSSSELDAGNAYYRYLWYNQSKITRTSYFKQQGYCVRCIKD